MKRCNCDDPKPFEVIGELVGESGTVYMTERYEQCDRCGGLIESTNDAGYSLPDEFPDDDGQDFNDEDVIT